MPTSRSTVVDDLPRIGPNYQGPGTYRHYKGGEYEVLGLAMHESELYRLVIYRPLTAGSKLSGSPVTYWARPEPDFNDIVEVGEFDYGTLRRIPRFTRVSRP